MCLVLSWVSEFAESDAERLCVYVYLTNPLYKQEHVIGIYFIYITSTTLRSISSWKSCVMQRYHIHKRLSHAYMHDFWFVFYLAAHGSGGITKIFIQRTDTLNEIAWYYCKCWVYNHETINMLNVTLAKQNSFMAQQPLRSRWTSFFFVTGKYTPCLSNI